jgi:hypothetical protein
VDQQELADALATFEGTPDERRVVARQARDLADAGRPDHFDRELTVADVVSNLADAPDDYALVGRWNWWVGSMELSHGGYDRFRVRR